MRYWFVFLAELVSMHFYEFLSGERQKKSVSPSTKEKSGSCIIYSFYSKGSCLVTNKAQWLLCEFNNRFQYGYPFSAVDVWWRDRVHLVTKGQVIQIIEIWHMCKCLILVLWISVRLKSSLEEALASNREQASDIAKLQDELRKTRSSLQVWNFSNEFVMFIIFVVQYITTDLYRFLNSTSTFDFISKVVKHHTNVNNITKSWNLKNNKNTSIANRT